MPLVSSNTHSNQIMFLNEAVFRGKDKIAVSTNFQAIA